MDTLKIDDNVKGNEVYTKETSKYSPMYLGTMKLIDGIWNLVSVGEDGNVVAVEYDSTATEALKMLNDELKSISIEDVKKLNELNTNNAGKIISF